MNPEFHVEEDFISEQERLSIRQTVLDHRQHWSDLRPERYSGIDFSTLGNALYIMEGEGQTVVDINQQVRSLLLEKFDWLYQRVCNKIEQLTGHPTRLHTELTVPGFHVVHKPSNTDDDTIGFFHNDMSILSYDVESNMESNRSVLIAIDIPSAGSYLLYKHNDEVRKLDYKLSAFHQWDARLDHKVGGLKLLSGEHRITLQSHYYYNARQQCNLVYF
jgi:hypothetical protein